MRFTKTHLMFFFFVGTLVGVQLVRKNLFPYNILRMWRKSLNEKKDNSQHISAPWVLPKKKDMDESYAMIPIEYLPDYELRSDTTGNMYYVENNGMDTLIINTANIGLVLMDTWATKDEKVSPPDYVLRQKRFLDQARQSNMSIIHSPNYPVVERYDQYHFLKKIVQDSLDQYELNRLAPIFLKDMQKLENDVFRKEKVIRKLSKAASYKTDPMEDRRISAYLTPNEDEYVLSSYEELMYVIWRHNLKLLIYIGGAMNECILTRPSGINRLKNSILQNGKALPISIIVLEDCSLIGESIMDSKMYKMAIIELFKRNYSLIANSEKIKFNYAIKKNLDSTNIEN